MSVDLKNPILIESCLGAGYADFMLSSELVNQIKRELKVPCLYLKNIHLEPIETPNESFRLNSSGPLLNLFITIKMDEEFTPTEMLHKVNQYFQLYIPDFKIMNYKNQELVVKTIPNQQIWTDSVDLLNWITPDKNPVLEKDQVYKGGLNWCVGDWIMSEEEMNNFFQQKHLQGVRYTQELNIASIDDLSVTNYLVGPKILCIQVESYVFDQLIPLTAPGYNEYEMDDSRNAFFSKHLSVTVYNYLSTIPFVKFYNLQDHIKMVDQTISWNFGERLNYIFSFTLSLGPYLQQFLFPQSNYEPIEHLSAYDFQLKQSVLGSVNQFYVLNFNMNPIRKNKFPIRLVYQGNLFGDNLISYDSEANYFQARLLAAITKVGSSFEPIFNPTMFIRNLDNLQCMNRFHIIDADNSPLIVHPKLSRVWFEMIFY